MQGIKNDSAWRRRLTNLEMDILANRLCPNRNSHHLAETPGFSIYILLKPSQVEEVDRKRVYIDGEEGCVE